MPVSARRGAGAHGRHGAQFPGRRDSSAQRPGSSACDACGRLTGRVQLAVCAGALPLSFVLALVVGAALGRGRNQRMPLVEVGIALSLVAFGAALLLKQTFRAPMLVAMTAGFALFHGHAHGAEMGADLSVASYGVGFAVATALLHVLGVLLTSSLLRPVFQPNSGSMERHRHHGCGLCLAGTATGGAGRYREAR